MAMDKSAADAYVYAKSSAILSKAYVFSKARALFSVKSLHELWSLLFRKEAPPVPETLLAKEIDRDSSYFWFLTNYKDIFNFKQIKIFHI